MGAYEYMPQAEDSDGDQLTDADEVLLHFSSPTNVNTDGDPVGDWEEAYADTSLTNPTSYFRISGISNDPMRVYWQSSSNRLYSLYKNDHLATGVWQAVQGQTDIPGSGGTDYLNVTNASASPRFYRIHVLPK
jgi:hypothetical protein